MYPLNTQPIEKPAPGDGSMLDVIEVWKTIQGEGPFAGTPAVFIRLAGCNLDCPACDTNYTTGRRLRQIADVVTEVMDKRAGCGLAVLTGGEPFRQVLLPFATKLLMTDMKVQVETNGTLWGDIPSVVSIVCSPKTPRINSAMLVRANAFKYILDADHVDPEDGLPSSSMGAPGRVARPRSGVEVFVQPLDETDPDKNQRNLQAAVESCLRHGYRLSIQIHKLAGVP